MVSFPMMMNPEVRTDRFVVGTWAACVGCVNRTRQLANQLVTPLCVRIAESRAASDGSQRRQGVHVCHRAAVPIALHAADPEHQDLYVAESARASERETRVLMGAMRVILAALGSVSRVATAEVDVILQWLEVKEEEVQAILATTPSPVAQSRLLLSLMTYHEETS